MSLFKSKPGETNFNSENHLKVILSKNQCLILEKDMLKKWYKKFTFLPKIVSEKMEFLQRTIVVCFTILFKDIKQ